MTHVQNATHVGGASFESGVYYATGGDVFLHFVGLLTVFFGSVGIAWILFKVFVRHFEKVDQLEKQVEELQEEGDE